MSNWLKTKITRDNGEEVIASAPYIISASRSTDIPAFYSDWFFYRLYMGYSAWINPFNNQRSYISYEKCKFIVFWSKNPKSLLNMQYYNFLHSKNIHIYIQYTLNNYEFENFEPNVPKLDSRIETFRELSKLYGKNAVIWRFDPLLLTDTITIENLLDRIYGIAEKIKDCTNKFVFSFVDISQYSKVKRNLDTANIHYKEWTESDMKLFAEKLNEMRIENDWKFDIATCSEKIDLSEYNIKHNKCIDDELIAKICPFDSELMDFLGMKIHFKGSDLLDDTVPEDAIPVMDDVYMIRTKSNRDSGQRMLCGCITSKDIGQYNTCPHKCVYCYANANNDIAMNNYNNYSKNYYHITETITGD